MWNTLLNSILLLLTSLLPYSAPVSLAFGLRGDPIDRIKEWADTLRVEKCGLQIKNKGSVMGSNPVRSARHSPGDDIPPTELWSCSCCVFRVTALVVRFIRVDFMFNSITPKNVGLTAAVVGRTELLCWPGGVAGQGLGWMNQEHGWCGQCGPLNQLKAAITAHPACSCATL